MRGWLVEWIISWCAGERFCRNPFVALAMKSRRTSSIRWNSDSLREPLSQWPTDLESCNETSADDFSDVDVERRFRGGRRYESDLSDVVGVVESSCEARRTFLRDQSSTSGQVRKSVNYDSDSCLTPRSRRTLRKTLSSSATAEPDHNPPSKAPELDTIFSPTHEILHPLQSLLLERSLSSKETHFSTRVGYRSFEAFPLPKPPQSMGLLSPKPKQTSGKVDSYNSHKFSKPTVEEEKLEQKQSLIDSRDCTLSTVNQEKSELGNPSKGHIVVIIVDAEKKLTFAALDWAINVAARPGDEIIILGVLKRVTSPTLGYRMVANTDPVYGINREFLQADVDKTTESFESKVSESGRRNECEKKKVKISVRIAPGARARTVVVRELQALGATYAIFDRKAMRSRRYYGKHLSCHAVRMRRNGRSTKTITQLVPSAKSKSPTSDISSVSSSVSTNESSSKSPTFWRRITSFRSSHCSSGSRRSPGSSPSSTHRSDITTSPLSLPDASETQQQEFPGLDQLKPLHLPETPPAQVSYLYNATGASHRKQRPAISVTVPPAICAN